MGGGARGAPTPTMYMQVMGPDGKQVLAPVFLAPNPSGPGFGPQAYGMLPGAQGAPQYFMIPPGALQGAGAAAAAAGARPPAGGAVAQQMFWQP
jgi:hypothetical protein